jgi:hypothetical protein
MLDQFYVCCLHARFIPDLDVISIWSDLGFFVPCKRPYRLLVWARFTPDARVTSANPTQMLRAPVARGARSKGCYFWTPLYFSFLPPISLPTPPPDVIILRRPTLTQGSWKALICAFLESSVNSHSTSLIHLGLLSFYNQHLNLTVKENVHIILINLKTKQFGPKSCFRSKRQDITIRRWCLFPVQWPPDQEHFEYTKKTMFKYRLI